MSTSSRSRVARLAREAVLDHTLRLVGGLPEAIAQDRFAEIVSDLHEQAAASDAAGRSGLRLAGGILRRALLGLPADAAWRVERAAEARSRVRTRPAAARVRLPGPERPFDQTNGVVALGADGPEAPDDTARRMLGLGLALNASFSGFGGAL